ncbi:MAG: helix-turn-helix domain-containing protein [archaeon]|jgi:sugar-specific transcriptional regulator TrmB
MLNESLRKLGLTEGEINVYLALLDLGESTKTALAKKSNVAPSNVYDITNRLIEKGLVSKMEKNGVAHFSPANPQRLIDFVEDKHKEIEEEKTEVQNVLPQLLSKFGKTKKALKIESFYGWQGLATVFRDLLSECNAGDENLIFGASTGTNPKQADLFFNKYSRMREKKKIFTKIIFNEDVRNRPERISFFLKSKQYDVRFIESKTPSEIIVYHNCAIILILTDEPIAVRFNGDEVAKSFRAYFELMWKQAKK